MDIFVKKLRSQESGYSGDKPDQRGKYILIPKSGYSIFPVLSEKTLNDTKVIIANINDGPSVGLNVVYHNAKFFPKLLSRAHNEVRLYRNSLLDEKLQLDRGVIVIILRQESGEYAFDSVQPEDSDYQTWESIAGSGGNAYSQKQLASESRIKQLRITVHQEIENSEEILESTASYLTKSRQQQESLQGDPGEVLLSLIKNQADFAKYLRNIYSNKCALRDESLIDNNSAGLDAAHIWAHTHGGPLLPTNGFLLSSDLHQCFDRGYFSIDDTNKVIIRNDVPMISSLRRFEGKIIKPSAGFEIFQPYALYNAAHRREHNYS